LTYVKNNFDVNFKVGDTEALLKVISDSFDKKEEEEEQNAELILEQLETLFDNNMDINAISDFNHDERKREYILNPNTEEILRIQRREIAAENLLVLFGSSTS